MKKTNTIGFVIAGLLTSCDVSKTETKSEHDQNTISNSKSSTMTKKETVGTFLGAVLKQ